MPYFGLCDQDGAPSQATPDDATGWFWCCHTGGSFVCPGKGLQRLLELSTYIGIFSGAPNVRLALYDALGILVCQGAAEVVVAAAYDWQGHIGPSTLVPAGGVAGQPVILTGGALYRFGVARDSSGVPSTLAGASASTTLGNIDYDPAVDFTGGWPGTIPSGTDYDNYLATTRALVIPIAGSVPQMANQQRMA